MTGQNAHASPELLARYASADSALGTDAAWALEVHLESCADCRAHLSDAVQGGPETTALLDRVRDNLDIEIDRSAQTPLRRRWLPRRTARWAAPTALPWLVMTVLVVLIAVAFDLAAQNAEGRLPSLVLLLAPMAPLLGVAAAWTQGRDPAHELVAATPRAGLPLVFRRTLAVLAVVIPVLAIGGLASGASPARWLLPCLAFTAGTLALGEVIGLPRAATGLALAWTAVVVAPSVATRSIPVVLEPASLPGWAALTAVIAVFLIARRNAYTQLPSGR